MERIARILSCGFLGVLFFLLTTEVSPAGVSRTEKSRVLFLSAHHPGDPIFFKEVDGIRSVLASPGSLVDIHLDIEGMDVKRFDSSKMRDAFHAILTYKLSQLAPYDLVMVGDDTALTYVLGHGKGLFKDLPFIFFGVEERALALAQNENPRVTGVVASASLFETLTLMTQLQPTMHRIIALSDGTETDMVAAFYAQARNFKSLQFSHLSLKKVSPETLPGVLAAIDPDDAVLFLSLCGDDTDDRRSFSSRLKSIIDHLKAPLYHLGDKGMGQGGIGGKLMSHYDQGRLAAEMALEVLKGRPIHELFVVAESPNRFMVDPTAMKSKGLSLARLPSHVDRFQDRSRVQEVHQAYSHGAMVLMGMIFFGLCLMAVTTFHRRRAGEHVARSERRFRQLTRHMEEVFCVGSMVTHEIDEISPSVEAIIGLTPSDLYQNASLLIEAVHPEDRSRCLAYLVAIHAGEETLAVLEFRMHDARGEERWIRFRGFGIEDSHSKLLKIAGMATEITDAKQEETAMKALVETLAGRMEEDYFDGAVRQICEFLNCDIAIIGEVRENDTIETLAMVQDGQMMPPMTYDMAGTPCLKTLSGEVCIYPEGVQVRYPSMGMLGQMGAEGYFGFPLRGRKGTNIGVMCAFSRRRFSIPKWTQEVMAILAKGIANEMERLESEREKTEMELSLIRSQKMEAMGTLAGGIAHDFNNILFPIMGYVQMMQEETPPESVHGEYLSKIHASSLRAKKLVDQILTFSRKGDQVFGPVSVPDVLVEVMDLVRASFPSTIELRVDIAPNTLPVMGDATQIHQVGMNLMTNAYHAMEGRSGSIQVELALSSEAAPGEEGGGPWLLLTVRDTGCGIDPSMMESIFDPYFTTRSKAKGTGLGLAVIHGIVKNHGGDISVESTLGMGTCFSVRFPCVGEGVRVEGVVRAPSIPRGDEHILVVDDEEEVCVVVQMMLERLGYTVSVASSGQDALAFFSQSASGVDLILSDMTMPSMTGVEFVARVRDLGYLVPVLLCTGLKDAGQERLAEELGVVGIVTKPVGMGELATEVRRALDGGQV